MGKLQKSIPFERALLYLLLLPLVPLFFIGCDFFSKHREIVFAEESLEQVQQQIAINEQKQSQNKSVRKYYAGGESGFLKNKLSSLLFLKKEKEAMESLKKKFSIPASDSFEKRYAFLTSGQNVLKFAGSEYALQEGIQETVFSTTQKVEVDNDDLKEILSLIESRSESHPQLIVSGFSLHKKTTSNQIEVYELQLQILQREFTE